MKILIFAALLFSAYHHPTGLDFRYPSDWTTREAPLAEVEFVPPDQQKNEQGITEGFLLWGIGGNFNDASDAVLLEHLNKLVTQLAPFLKRQEKTEDLQSDSTTGKMIAWSGSSPDGLAVAARVFVTTHNGAAYAILMLGSEDRMILREPAIRDIFKSFRFSEGTRDPALLGSWSSSVATTQSQTSQPELQMRMQTDGSFAFVDPSNSSGELRGTWYAGDARLSFVIPESFFISFHYEIDGPPGARKLILRHSSGGVQTLQELPTQK